MEMERLEHFAIQQAANLTGLSAHTLRYYERIGLIESICRTESGHRQYTEADLGWIEFLKCLRATGMPIAQMQHYADLTRAGEYTVADRLELLEVHRRAVLDQIAELQDYLAVLDYKVNYYTREKTLLEEVE